MQSPSAPAIEESGPYLSGNRLLDALPPADREAFAGDIAVLNIAVHKSTHSAGDAIAYVDFPIDAVLSVVATLESGDSIEVGTIGCESFVESDLALSSDRAQRTSFCQVRGRIGRMPVERFASHMAASEPFARMMRRNVRASLFSTQQFAACNVRHSILQRCARWLAMTEDRVGRPEFVLTHELLSVMLGVRRASVSEAADALHMMGAIAYRRGTITVLDRDRLRSTACECYEACKHAFSQSLLS